MRRRSRSVRSHAASRSASSAFPYRPSSTIRSIRSSTSTGIGRLTEFLLCSSQTAAGHALSLACASQATKLAARWSEIGDRHRFDRLSWLEAEDAGEEVKLAVQGAAEITRFFHGEAALETVREAPEVVWPGPAGRGEKGRYIPLNILRSVRFMEIHLQGDLSLAVLAHEAAMSKHHYCRAFKGTMGMSPMRFVNYLRVQKAKLLLEGNDLNISAVAKKSGFDSLNTLNRWFKAFEKTSPSLFHSGIRAHRRI